MGGTSSVHTYMERDSRVGDAMTSLNQLHADVGAANVMASKYAKVIGCRLRFDKITTSAKYLFWSWRAPGNVSVDCKLSNFSGTFVDYGGVMRLPKTLTLKQFYVVFNILQDVHEDYFSSPHGFQLDVTTPPPPGNDDRTRNNSAGSASKNISSLQIVEVGKQCGSSTCDSQVHQEEIDEEIDEEECSICMDGKYEVLLKCNHSFCEQCYLFWRQKSDTCPVCRQNACTDVIYFDAKSTCDDIHRYTPVQKLKIFFQSLGRMEIPPRNYHADSHHHYGHTPSSHHQVPVYHWTCEVCTFGNNTSRRSTCMVCGAHRQQAVEAPLESGNGLDMDLQLAILLSME